ncbi:MAG TPA: DUF1289 domain-containing protein [Methylocella sp.]|nr:DUF1289 domain-containing protein [Methylocella sp.]
MTIQTPIIPSPCTGICTMDEALGFCLGCARTREEIEEWANAPPSRRLAIWDELPARCEELKIPITRLPWPPDQIAAFAAAALKENSGTWVLGCYGACAEFFYPQGEGFEVSASGGAVTALSKQGALRLSIGSYARALQLRPGHGGGGSEAIFLVIAKTRASLPAASVLTPLGPDEGAIDPGARCYPLFDLGIGRADLRFCVRLAAPELADVLIRLSGRPLEEVLAKAGSLLIKHSPARVVETVLGRAEIFTPIPPPGSAPALGPHTHLLPSLLSAGRSAPPGIDLPPAYALGATFYPKPVPPGNTHPCSQTACRGGL